MALDTKIEVVVQAVLTAGADLSTIGTWPLTYPKIFNLASGTGANQADKLWWDSRTLAASGTENLDLAGSLTDAFGAALTFVKLKGIWVYGALANTNNVNVTRPATNGVPLFLAAGDGLPVLPGGLFSWVAPGAGVTVTAATADLITITNSAGGTPVTYDVILLGSSA